MKRILPLDPATYQRHRIHGADRTWIETNCYVDVWVELLHALGHEPIAGLAFALTIDFEGDQWTFFKYPPADLLHLYGLDVHEFAVWRPLLAHIEEQVTLGRYLLIELDSYFLPDTAGTAYQREHVKSTVAVNEIDVAHQRLGYFHNQAYHLLQGDDFVNVFYLKEPRDPSRLPPYVELVKRRRPPLGQPELVQASLRLLRAHLQMMPETNPFHAFRTRFEADLPWLMNESQETFHQYSFATLRQFGACYELAATYLQWLQAHNVAGLDGPLAAFTSFSNGAKSLQFNLARSMARKKPLNLASLEQMAETWQTAVTELKTAFL